MIAREIDVEDVGAVTARERPDVALVGLGEPSRYVRASAYGWFITTTTR